MANIALVIDDVTPVAATAASDVTSGIVEASDYGSSAATLLTSDDDDEVACNLYDFVVCTVVIGLICLFGLTGNVTSFLVLYKQHKTETAAIFLLQCMAVFDSLLLCVSMVVYTLPYVYPYTGRLQAVYQSFHFITASVSLSLL